LVAASDGRGFVVDGEEGVAQTRAGKQVLTPGEGAVARICVRAEGGDAVALVGDNRRMLIVKLDDIPLMTRGRGVILQRYKSGGLADCKVFRLADGLSWRQGESRTRTEIDLAPWLGLTPFARAPRHRGPEAGLTAWWRTGRCRRRPPPRRA